MDQNSKLAFGAVAAVIMFHTLRIRKLNKHQAILLEGVLTLIDAVEQQETNEKFKDIIENLDM